jgi:hypothetical protein
MGSRFRVWGIDLNGAEDLDGIEHDEGFIHLLVAFPIRINHLRMPLIRLQSLAGQVASGQHDSSSSFP